MKVEYNDLLKNFSKYNNTTWEDQNFSDVISKAEYYLKLAYSHAHSFSHDPHTQIGSVIVDSRGIPISYGTNKLTPGMYGIYDTPEEIRNSQAVQKPQKYENIEHAERNSIYGIITSSLVQKEQNPCYIMFCPYFSCVECSRAIINSNIKVVIGHKNVLDLTPDRWKQSIQKGRELFDKANVLYCEYEGTINAPSVMMNGELFTP